MGHRALRLRRSQRRIGTAKIAQDFALAPLKEH